MEENKPDPRLHFVVATAIIVKNGGSSEPRFLIAKRAAHEKAFPDKWTVPGGKLVLHEYERLPTGFRDNHVVVITAKEGSGGKLEVPPVSENREAGVRNRGFLRRSEATTPQWYNVVDWVLRKEVMEEVGLEIGKPQYLCDLVFVRPDGYPVVTLSYWADYKSGDVKLCKDLTEYAWVTVEEAKKYDLIEGIWEELRDVRVRLTN